MIRVYSYKSYMSVASMLETAEDNAHLSSPTIKPCPDAKMGSRCIPFPSRGRNRVANSDAREARF